MSTHRNQPLAEVFGFPITDLSSDAVRHRSERLCPFHNKVAQCTKVSVTDPLGVCSVFDRDGSPTITCPIRFREDWLIAEDAAKFFFPAGANWEMLPESRLKTVDGKSAGNVDIMLVQLDANNQIIDFGSLEIQGVYISGNVSDPFKAYISNPTPEFSWRGHPKYPGPDYLSSSRKRLAPQLLYKGGIFKQWNKKQAVALHRNFYETLPALPEVSPEEADIAWFLYTLEPDCSGRYKLQRYKTIYTEFEAAMLTITKTSGGDIDKYQQVLQRNLDNKSSVPPLSAEDLIIPE